MFAKVTKTFAGKPDNEQVARQVPAGEVIGGELALVAVRQGWAVEVPPNSRSGGAEAVLPDGIFRKPRAKR